MYTAPHRTYPQINKFIYFNVISFTRMLVTPKYVVVGCVQKYFVLWCRLDLIWWKNGDAIRGCNRKSYIRRSIYSLHTFCERVSSLSGTVCVMWKAHYRKIGTENYITYSRFLVFPQALLCKRAFVHNFVTEDLQMFIVCMNNMAHSWALHSRSVLKFVLVFSI
jgi:hypothetical protein